MSEVTLHIGGSNYKIACAQGEEVQVAKLGSMIDERLRQLEGNLSASPAQNLLFAALFLADELSEAQAKGGGKQEAENSGELEKSRQAISELKLELDAIRTERDESLRELAMLRQSAESQGESHSDNPMAERLERLAAGLESCASALEDKAGVESGARAS